MPAHRTSLGIAEFLELTAPPFDINARDPGRPPSDHTPKKRDSDEHGANNQDPDIKRMSWVCLLATISPPAERKALDLNKACLNKWVKHAAGDPMNKVKHISPRWDNVDMATIRLIS